MEVIKGTAASPGMAMGDAYLLQTNSLELSEVRKISDISLELDRFQNALNFVKDQISEVKATMQGKVNTEELSIYDAHIEILSDPELIDQSIHLIENEQLASENAIYKISRGFIQQLEELDDEYLSARAKDITEVTDQVIMRLLGKQIQRIAPSKPCILVAKSITANLISALDPKLILGIITAEGGATDHTAILSKAIGIPAIVGIGEYQNIIAKGDKLLIDSEKGIIQVNPSLSQLEEFQLRFSTYKTNKKIALNNSKAIALTKSRKTIKVYANISSKEEALKAGKLGAEGVGLLRTEFCFLERKTFPTEDEQYELYKEILDAFPEKAFVIRLIDFGSDKKVGFIDFENEENPALGVRALRLGYKYYDTLLGPQIRAILRLSQNYDIKLLCPMIACLEDLEQIRKSVNDEISSLTKMGFNVDENIQLGIMVEIPHVAFFPELFVEHVDFFSFGTNDLAQFMMAADRTNNQVSIYIDLAKPGILKLIQKLTQVAHNHGKWVGICGEMASDTSVIAQLINFGVDEISMPPSLIPDVKAFIRGLK